METPVNWVEGTALELVIALGEVRVGDEVKCQICHQAHRVHAVKESGIPVVMVQSTVAHDGKSYLRTTSWSEITAWRRP